MLITLTQEDLEGMPEDLRRDLWNFFASGEVGATRVSAARPNDLPSARDGIVESTETEAPFDFVSPPRRSRHPDRKVISLDTSDAKAFVDDCRGRKDGDVLLDVLYRISRCQTPVDTIDCCPADLAAEFDLRDRHGNPDARLVSPYLKRVTHAVREFANDEEAGWYTLDRSGDFWLDAETATNLKQILGGRDIERHPENYGPDVIEAHLAMVQRDHSREPEAGSEE